MIYRLIIEDDNWYKKVKAHAAREGITIKTMILRGLLMQMGTIRPPVIKRKARKK